MQSTSTLRVLVIGDGGKEHAIAWKLSLSESVEHVFVIPGNGGTNRGLHKVSNIDNPDIDNMPESQAFGNLVLVAKQHKIGLVVVGTRWLVLDGIEDHFRQANIPCFAPSKEAAELDSKSLAKAFIKEHNIPTAQYRTFYQSTYEQARKYVQSISHRIIMKVDSVYESTAIFPKTTEKALEQLEQNLIGNNQPLVIEEFLEGHEISVSTLSDGYTTFTLPIGQEYKRISDGDHGSNTGGMGFVAPVPFVTPEIESNINDAILKPTFEGLRREGREFRGLLTTTIILTRHGPQVLGYNVGFDDPETQTILPLFSPEIDFAQVLLACTSAQLHQVKFQLPTSLKCSSVIIAIDGYPNAYWIGHKITLDELPKGCILFHSGTKYRGDQLITAGGRVFTVVGMGNSSCEAVAVAYEGVKSVKFEEMRYRTDIGQR